ncbi:MAG TPA: IPT/TIG domain-containing protein, partial [bacterium]|nr:IPT/TIG domain-containing protein [bacterium]
MRRRASIFFCLLPLLLFVTQCQELGRSLSISSVDPSAGTVWGGNEVTVRGSNFPSNPVVTFGGLSATVVSSTSSGILVNVPAPASGETGGVDVNVTDAL